MSRENLKSEQQPARLESFLQSYGNFLTECSNHPHNLELLIKDFTQSIPPPPESSKQNE